MMTDKALAANRFRIQVHDNPGRNHVDVEGQQKFTSIQTAVRRGVRPVHLVIGHSRNGGCALIGSPKRHEDEYQVASLVFLITRLAA
jgi:hypothetical protein